jgi:hypothetical protein
VLLKVLNDSRTKAIISNQGIPTSKDQTVILGDRLEHVVQFMRNQNYLSIIIIYAVCAKKIKFPANFCREFS